MNEDDNEQSLVRLFWKPKCSYIEILIFSHQTTPYFILLLLFFPMEVWKSVSKVLLFELSVISAYTCRVEMNKDLLLHIYTILTHTCIRNCLRINQLAFKACLTEGIPQR